MTTIDTGFANLEYTSPFAGVGIPARLDERRPAASGGSCAPFASRLGALPPRTVADWSAHVTGCATIYNLPLPDNHGRPEIFERGAFVGDDGVEIPVLINHDYDRHVGWARLEHRTDGLYFSGQLRRDGARAIGDWRGVSLGFCSISLTPGRTRRHYNAMALEVSVCERGVHHPHSYLRMLDDITLAA